MNEKIKIHISNYIKKQYPKTQDITEDDIIECLYESDIIYEEDCGSSRWWMNTFRVVEIEGMLIGFDYAKTTGDDTPRDKGWDFNPESICEVEKKEEVKVITKYIKK